MDNLSSTGFKSMRKGLIMHGSLFNDTHFVARNSLKFNNPISQSIIFYYSSPLNVCECYVIKYFKFINSIIIN